MRRLVLLLILCLLGSPVKAAEQARGFGTTLGVASTDRIVSALTSNATQRTYAFWFKRNLPGGGGVARIFDKDNAGAEVEYFQNNEGTTTYRYQRTWSGGSVNWSIPQPSASVWHHIAITYDSGSTSNNPLIYVDGVPQTVTLQTAAPSGTVVTNSDPYILGNRAAGDRDIDGILSQFAVWNRILTSTEITNLATTIGSYNGWAPSCYSTSLAEYIKLNDSPVTSSVLANPTVTGTAQQTGLTIDYACGVVTTTVIGGRRILP